MFKIEKGIATLLRGDATLRGLAPGGIHRETAPPTVAGVHIVWQWFGNPQHKNVAGGQDGGYVRANLLVKALGEGFDQEPAANAFERAEDLLLGKVSGSTLAIPSGWALMGISRNSHISGGVPQGDRHFQQVGGIYLLLAEKL